MLIQHSSKQMKTQQGVGLIEVLVAVLILTVGILGLVGLQTRALQFSQESMLQSQAQMLAYEVTDRMRANKGALAKYIVLFEESVTSSANCSSSACSENDMARYDLAEWKSLLAASLPSGDGSIAVDKSGARPFYTITVRFRDSKLDKSLAGGAGNDVWRQTTIRTEI